MKTFAKAACFLAVLMMSQTAFAQITLDLDVLTEDFVPKDATTSAPVLKKPAPKKTEKKEQQKLIPLKPPAAKKAEKPKTKPAAKPTAPKKPAAKPVKKTEKLEVKESAVKDEHDKLKPRANPVPKVKVLAAETREVTTPEEKPEIIIEPKISKHFLEQERQKLEEEKAQAEATTAPAVRETPAPVRKQDPVKTEQALNKSEPAPETTPDKNETVDRENARRQTPQMLLTPKIRKEQAAAQPATPVLKSSVFHVSNRLTPDERSVVLSKEIPEDSATRLALAKNKKLVQIFLFEENSADLSEEMQIALNSLAARLKKNPEKRLTLYSYSAPNPSGNGRERQISLRRALMVRSYLSRLGVRSLRVEIRSQGQKGAGTAIPDRTDILIED